MGVASGVAPRSLPGGARGFVWAGAQGRLWDRELPGRRMKVPTSECVPSIALAQPGPVTKLARKKNKKRFWKKKAQGGSRRPGSDPRVVAERPPKAPEDFSQNWKALQEVRPEGPGGRLHQPGILVGWPQDAKEKRTREWPQNTRGGRFEPKFLRTVHRKSGLQRGGRRPCGQQIADA